MSGYTFASVWLEPSDVRLKLDIERLKHSGDLHLPALSWPVYAPDLERALLAMDWAELSRLQKRAYNRLKRRLERIQRRQFDLDPKKQLHLGYVDSTKDLRGFESEVSHQEGGYIGVSTEQIYKKVAFKITAIHTEASQKLDHSYFTTNFGKAVVTVGSQSRWWGPGYDNNLLWSTQARPVTGIHLQHRSSAPSALPGLGFLGPVSGQIFAGRLSSSSTPNPEEDTFNLYGARLAFQPFNTFTFAATQMRFNKVNLVANQPVSQDVLGLDMAWNMTAFEWPATVYAQMAQAKNLALNVPRANNRNYLLGVSAPQVIENSHGNLSVWLEYIDTSEGLLAPGLDKTTASDGALYQQQPLGVSFGPGAQGVSVGGVWSGPNGMAVKGWLRAVDWLAVSSGATQYNPLLARLGATQGDVAMTELGVSVEWYPSKHLKVQPSLYTQNFSGKLSQPSDNMNARLHLSYLF